MSDGEVNEEKVNNEETKEKSYFDRNDDSRSYFRTKQKKPVNYKMFIAYRFIYISLMILIMAFDKVVQFTLTQKYGQFVMNEELYRYAKIVEGLIWVFIFFIPITVIIYLNYKKDCPPKEELMYYIFSIAIDGGILIIAMGIINVIFRTL